MKCPIKTQENPDVVLAYCAGSLSRDTAAELERHMEACPECRSTVDAQQAVWDALDRWEAAPVAADFDRRLYRRIEREASVRWWSRLRLVPVAVAASLLLVAGALVDTNRPAVQGRAELRFETVQADQVEATLEDMELLRSFTVETQHANSI